MRNASLLKICRLRYYSAAMLVLVLDQLSKYWAWHHLPMNRPVTVMAHLNWRLSLNAGAAFSLLDGGFTWQQWLLIGLAFVVCAGLIISLWRMPQSQANLKWAFALILGGALGNLIDRSYSGFVTDFIDFYIQWDGRFMHWPVFNLADSAICMGGLLLLCYEMRSER